MPRRIGFLLLLVLSACATSNDDRVVPTLFQPDTPIPRQPQNELRYWEPAEGVIDPDAPEVWQFAGLGGDAVTVRVLAPGLSPQVEVQTYEGAPLASATGTVNTTLPENGVYLVVVSAGEDGAGGAYDIGLRYTDRPNPSEIAPTPIPQVVGVPTPIPVCTELETLTYITRLENDQTFGQEMTPDSPDHLYLFEAEADEFAEIEVVGVTGGFDPVVTLYDTECSALAVDDNSGSGLNAMLRNVPLPDDGLYSVRVSMSERITEGSVPEGGYSIRLLRYERFSPVTPTAVLPPTATFVPEFVLPTLGPVIPGNRLESHIPVRWELSEPGAVARHSFYATAGEIVTVGVSPLEDSELRPQIEIVNPEGSIVAGVTAAASNAGGDALVPNLRIDVEGPHTVFISGEGESFGEYLVSFGDGSTRAETYLGDARFGEPYNGTIERYGFRDLYTLHLQAGDVITASVSPDEGSRLNPLLELVFVESQEDSLYFVPGAVIASDDNSGGGLTAQISNVRINRTGLYLLRVRAVQAATTGAYTLIWRYVNAAPTPTSPPAIFPVLTVSDEVGENEYRFYPFQGRAGQQILVRVVPAIDTEFDPVAALIGADGTVLTEVDDVEDSLAPTFEFELPADGTYNVRVNGYLSSGAYTVVVEELF